MAKHECPDCGASHEMNAEERIKRLEKRIEELEAARPVCPHPHYWYTPTYYPTWTSNTTSTVPNGPITVYGVTSNTSGLLE